MSLKITGDYHIVTPKNPDTGTKYAAEELAKYLKAIGGVELTIGCCGCPAQEKEIVIGRTDRCGTPNGANLKNDGYVLRTVGERLFIFGENDRANLYGVYGLLENVLGCRFYTSTVEKIPTMDVIEIPELDETVVSPFEYRQTNWNEMAYSAEYAYKRGLNSQKHPAATSILAQSLCHTMFNFVSPDEFFDEHPEYFSMIEGRRIRDHAQLCLTNPEVLQIVIERLKKTIDEHPECKIFSVSQMDWYNPCTCPECAAIDEAEGSQMGTMLRFVNAVAEAIEPEYPDVIVETLAYQYTRQAPKITKPRHNVSICLCSIECCFTHPLRECHRAMFPFIFATTPGVTFQQDLMDWAKICKRVLIWDYTTNFRFYLAPMVNLHVLQDNVKFFIENGVTQLFEQGNAETPSGEFGELRAYLLTKLMWEPDGDFYGWMDDFLAGYYGKAAAPIRKFIDMLQDHVTRYDLHAGIYESPKAFLHNALIPKGDALWDEAEALADNEDVLKRVRKSRLQWRFLKFHRKGFGDDDFSEVCEKLIEDLREMGITHIQEGKKFEKSADEMRHGTLPGTSRSDYRW